MAWVNPVAFDNADPLTLVLANQYMVDNPQFTFDHLGEVRAKAGHVSVDATGVNLIDIEDIPQGYDHLLIKGFARTTYTAGTVGRISVRFNGDASSLYDVSEMTLSNTTFSGAPTDAGSRLEVPIWSSSGSVDAGLFSPVNIEIFRYSSAYFKSGHYSSFYAVDTTTGKRLRRASFAYLSADPIEMIRLQSMDSAEFQVGSLFSVYCFRSDEVS